MVPAVSVSRALHEEPQLCPAVFVSEASGKAQLQQVPAVTVTVLFFSPIFWDAEVYFSREFGGALKFQAQ